MGDNVVCERWWVTMWCVKDGGVTKWWVKLSGRGGGGRGGIQNQKQERHKK